MTGSLGITLVAGFLSFLGLYLTFDYWYQRFWVRGMKRNHEETVKLAEDIFVDRTPESIMNLQIMWGAGAALFIVFFTFPYLTIGFPFGAVAFYWAWRIPKLYYGAHVRPTRIKKFSGQMVDALVLMANGLKSGLNVPQTLQIVVDEMPNPISQEFRLVLTENKVGLTFEKAFENLAVRIPSEDVSMFVTSVNILRETGGNIAETFDTIAETIRQRMKLQSKISAMVAQGMMSAIIVGALPWGLGVMLYFIDPVRMRPLFTTPVGWLILLAILILESIGFVVILKIVKIKV